MTKEIWKDCHVNKRYKVSNLGNVTTLSGRLRRITTGYNGYPRICYRDCSGNVKTIEVHRLVAKAFIPTITGKEHVNHKNGNKLDNRVENLEWVTHSENMKHAWVTGLHPRKYKKRNGQGNTKTSSKNPS